MTGDCDVKKLLGELLATYLDVVKRLDVDVKYDEASGAVTVPFGNSIPASLIKAMVPILNGRLAGREVVYEGFNGVAYVRAKARIREVVYADVFTTGEDMGGFIIVMGSLEGEPRVFETRVPIRGKTDVINILNTALLLRNNPWLIGEIVSAAKEASEVLARGSGAIIKAYTALKILGLA